MVYIKLFDVARLEINKIIVKGSRNLGIICKINVYLSQTSDNFWIDEYAC